MQFNSISPIPEDDEELHLPELVYWASLGDIEQVEQGLQEGLDVNSAESSCFLKISQIQVRAQEALGLAEYGSDHVRPLHYPLGCYIRINNIFSCINILHIRHLLF